MSDDDRPQTRLEQVLRQQHWTVRTFLRHYREASGEELSERQAYRWLAGDVRKLPYPHARAALEQLFGEPASRLFGPPHGVAATPRAEQVQERRGGHATDDWEDRLVATAADRARGFLARIEVSNVGHGTLDHLVDAVRRLVRDSDKLYDTVDVLVEIADTQAQVFALLDGRQRPSQARDLSLLAGISSGLVAKASHDLGSPHDALTQARVAYACADNAGHDGLRARTRGLQLLISYWAGRFTDSLRFAELGAAAADRTRGSAAIWLLNGKARTRAARGRLDEAHAAIDHAGDLRERVELDELDHFGGTCTFGRSRQLYYAADAMAWGGEPEAHHTERLALDALAAYEAAPAVERAFGDEAGARCDLAVARVLRGDVEGAVDALGPVLGLPAAHRIHGVVTSTEHVHRALLGMRSASPVADHLRDALADFAATRFTLPR